MLSGFLFFALAFVVNANLAPLIENPLGKSIAGEYIIIYKDALAEETFAKELQFATENYNVHFKYELVLRGFSAFLNADELASVRANPLVEFVEVNQEVNVACVDTTAKSWGLTRISQAAMNLNGRYSYPDAAGSGVDVYVIDTGIYTANVDFGGRATFGFKAEAEWSQNDANGHGTHVASTIMGTQYGVARAAHAIAVKVLGDNGSGSNAGVIAGVEWATQQGRGKSSVINMSLGGSFSQALNNAVDAAADAGLVVVVAAGNSNVDACSSSPASATEVICVGATSEGAGAADVRASYSNYGSCVDIFAPGSLIKAAWIGSTTATNTISGTSMASPHVAGVAALFWSESPSATSATIRAQVIGDATENTISFNCPPSGKTCGQSPNLMLFNGC